ncbi:MAG: hypothetical protein ACRCXC_12290 [Legionella sp.]
MEFYPSEISTNNLLSIQENVKETYSKLTEKLKFLARKSDGLESQDETHQKNIQSIREYVWILIRELETIKMSVKTTINDPIVEMQHSKTCSPEDYFGFVNSFYHFQEMANRFIGQIDQVDKKIDEEIQAETHFKMQKMRKRLAALHNQLKENKSDFAKEMIQLIAPIIESSESEKDLELGDIVQIHQEVEATIGQKQKSIEESQGFKTLLELNGNVLLSENEKDALVDQISHVTKALHFSLVDTNVEDLFAKLLQLETSIDFAIKRTNDLFAERSRCFARLPLRSEFEESIS